MEGAYSNIKFDSKYPALGGGVPSSIPFPKCWIFAIKECK